jgi:DNA repair protein RecN (Recombination protein N)
VQFFRRSFTHFSRPNFDFRYIGEFFDISSHAQPFAQWVISARIVFPVFSGCAFVLIGLSISQFTIVDSLNIDFSNGMTAITGETGAGKSIALDALGMALGERADSNLVRHGADKADIRAVFNVQQLPLVKSWLIGNDFDAEDDCILRRVITKDGRSKAFINDQPVNLQTLKTLGSLLVDIHSQHAHHQLLQRDYHQTLLDAYADCQKLLTEVGTYFHEWQHTCKHIRDLQKQADEADTRKEYLLFQLKEFTELGLMPGEFAQLEKRHQQIANAESLQSVCQETLDICRDNERQSLIAQLQHCEHLLSPLTQHSTQIKDAVELLNSANIQIQEACQSLKQQLNRNQNSSDNLEDIESRLASILDLARKHRTPPAELLAIKDALQAELETLENNTSLLQQLQQDAARQLETYQGSAHQLTQVRKNAAQKLAGEIKLQLAALGMASCEFMPVLCTDTTQPKAHGFENTEFLVSTNPGQPPQGLHKIASGGELSRISLAIQVITAKASTIPTLVFDEVDVGIGGATAEVVGRLLRTLSESAQLICVTHQPQVAAQAHQHYFVAKTQGKDTTQTSVTALDKNARIKEIARMLGGVEITPTTLKHAKEMLKL